MCVCVCVCVRVRERESERECRKLRKTERDWNKERERKKECNKQRKTEIEIVLKEKESGNEIGRERKKE